MCTGNKWAKNPNPCICNDTFYLMFCNPSAILYTFTNALSSSMILEMHEFDSAFVFFDMSRGENPLKDLRWSFLQKLFMTFSHFK